MILTRYRGQIIDHNLKSVQTYYTPPTTVLESYLGTTVLESYLGTTVLESYLTVGGGLWILVFILPIILILPIVGLAESTDESESHTTLSDFGNSPKTNDEQQNESQSDREEPSEHDGKELAYAYVRQSETDDPDDSGSIKAQNSNTSDVAAEHGYYIYKRFIDKNESGFSFERESFEEMISNIQNNPGPVVLDRVDRLGRDTLETIYVAAQLHYIYEVKIITYVYGEYDLSKNSDQIQLVVKAIAAGHSVKNRIRAAWDAIHELFEEDRTWYAWFDKIPVGYHQPDDETWIRPHPDGQEVVSAIMHDLCEIQTYTEVMRLLQNVEGNKTLETNNDTQYALTQIDSEKIRSVFEASDYDFESFDPERSGTGILKRMMTDTVYIGKVRYPRNEEEENQNVIEDDNLKLVDEDLFDQVNDVVQDIESQNSPSSSDGVDTARLADLGIVLKAVDIIDNFGPICPECNQGMVKNGGADLNDGRDAWYWACPKLTSEDEDPDKQRKVPYEDEWDELKEHINEEYDGEDVVVLETCRFEEH